MILDKYIPEYATVTGMSKFEIIVPKVLQEFVEGIIKSNYWITTDDIVVHDQEDDDLPTEVTLRYPYGCSEHMQDLLLKAEFPFQLEVSTDYDERAWMYRHREDGEWVTTTFSDTTSQVSAHNMLQMLAQEDIQDVTIFLNKLHNHCEHKQFTAEDKVLSDAQALRYLVSGSIA